MQLLQWQSKGAKDWIKCSVSGQYNLHGSGETCLKLTRNDDDLCFLKSRRNCSQLSICSTMPENFIPTLVYHRKTQQKNTDAIFTTRPSNDMKPSNGCHSAISSDALSLADQELAVSVSEHAPDALRSPIMQPVECNMSVPSSNGYHAREVPGSKDVLAIDGDRVLNVCIADDNCSSSKSNLELGSASLKTDMVDGGDSSSSGASIADKGSEEISERDICISILRNQGLLDRVSHRQHQAFTKSTVSRGDCYCSMLCKVCECMESTLNMLVCDNCEDAFHVSCHNPHMKILPKGEWLCPSCLKKKHKILKDKSTGTSANMSSEIERNQCSSLEGELGSLEFMLRDTEPYMSNVRIGDEFQADVPDWCGLINEECDLVGDPLEMNPSDNIVVKEQDSVTPLKLNSIGNWIQCQAVIEGIGEDVDGTICGKWRRAPLLEVQTDDWECYRCILWDPSRADCSVPQEADTAEVTRQLKYIEMLRPRLAAKRRKLDHSKRALADKSCR